MLPKREQLIEATPQILTTTVNTLRSWDKEVWNKFNQSTRTGLSQIKDPDSEIPIASIYKTYGNRDALLGLYASCANPYDKAIEYFLYTQAYNYTQLYSNTNRYLVTPVQILQTFFEYIQDKCDSSVLAEAHMKAIEGENTEHWPLNNHLAWKVVRIITQENTRIALSELHDSGWFYDRGSEFIKLCELSGKYGELYQTRIDQTLELYNC